MAACVWALLLLLPAAAAAHVTVLPAAAPAGSRTVFDVRVPNERDDAATVRVDLKLPPGVVAAAWEPMPGWRVRVIRERLDRPIETENGPIPEQVSRVVWSGDGSAAGRIPPGAFQDFPLSVALPAEPGTTLDFKALQTYDDGEIVRWIGAPDAELPAARVALTDAESEGDGVGAGHGGGASGAAGTSGEEGGAGGAAAAAGKAGGAGGAAGSSADSGDGASKGLAIAGLVAGVGGLLLGGAALLLAGRRRSRPAPTSDH